MMVDRYINTVVIGGGQAGLTMGYYLAAQERDFVILDVSERVAAIQPRQWFRRHPPASVLRGIVALRAENGGTEA